MKVYIVYNEALHHDSSYHDILGVFSKKEDAETCIGTSIYDINKAIDRGDWGDEFISIETNKDNMPINPNEWDEYICSSFGYYEAFRVEEYEVM